MSIGGRKTSAAWLLLIPILAASSLTCITENVPKWQPEPRVYTAKEAEEWAHIRETAVALQLTQTAVAQIEAERAAKAAQEAAEAAEEAAGAASGEHVPVITDVDFPAVVPANGQQAQGTITFTDARQDVNRVNIQTLEGTFPTGGWDPRADLKWAGWEGRTPFSGICGRTEFVRAVITVQDAAGNVSQGYTLSFYCQ